MPARLNPRELAEGAKQCLFCGFCEPVCPTLRHGPHRGYGPRGRVLVVARVIAAGYATREAVEAIYTCLLCRSCVEVCPASLNVPELVRGVRVLLAEGRVAVKAGSR